MEDIPRKAVGKKMESDVGLKCIQHNFKQTSAIQCLGWYIHAFK